jgi:MFS family permease
MSQELHEEMLGRDAGLDGRAGEVMVARRSPFMALRYRNFRLFVFGQLISLAGTWMQMVAQQWVVFSLTHSAAWLGIVSGASAIPYVAFSVLGGHTADRLPRRSILVVTQVAAMVLAAVLALLATNRWVALHAWHIAVIAGLMGIVNAFNMPAQQAFVPEMVEDRAALGNAIALNSLMFNTARFLGPIFAGAVLVKLGAFACFGLNAASYIAVIISLLMMRVAREERIERRESVWEGFRFIWQNRTVLRTVAMIGIASMTVWSISTLYPVIAAHFGRGAAGYSAIMSLNGVGAAVGGLFVAGAGHRFVRRSLIYSGAIACSLCFLALTWMPAFYPALACLLTAGFFMIIFGVNAQTKVQEDVSDALRGRVMAVYSLVFSALMPLGGLLIGFLAEHVGPMNAVRASSLTSMAAALALYTWSQRDVASRQAGFRESRVRTTA